MKKGKLLSAIITMSLTVVTVITASFAWFQAYNGNKDYGANGQIGLRNYFYQGDGSESNPYEIVLPQHLYNLSRLQNFGLISNNSHFRIGHDFEGDNTYQCLKVDENGVVVQPKEYVNYLDMSSISSKVSFMCIGSEANPFSGIFDGNNLSVLNLTVNANLEDMGLFGYCDSDSHIQNLTLSKFTLNCLGYNSKVADSSKEPIDDLYSIEVSNAMEQNTVFEKADLIYHDEDKSTVTKFREGKIIVGTTFSGIENDPLKVDDYTYSKSYFEPYFDTSDSRFEYSVKVSNGALKVLNDDNGNQIVRLNLSFLEQNDDFMSKNTEIDTRISLVASTTVDNRKYSRVIQSYLVKVYSNRSSTTQTSNGYTMSVYTDYVDPKEDSKYTNYFHGNNIGFIAGHVDGSMTNCYVYDSLINLNKGDDSFKKVETETEIGLIGEVGVNVTNNLSPEYGLKENGEIGVINFSGIYSSIRKDYGTNETQKSILKVDSSGTNQYYVDYTNYLNMDTYNIYAEYLRTTDATEPTYITRSGTSGAGDFTADTGSAANSVDFWGQRLIEDTVEYDRGLGIFKVATSTDRSTFDAADYNKTNYFINGLGSSSITNGTSYTTVYYSTTEIAAKDGINVTSWIPNVGSHPSGNIYNYIENMGTIPDYADSKTFSSKYEARTNYLFKLDFGTDNSVVGNNSYFYNTDNLLLKEYFKYKLIDKYGDSIEPGNTRFGLMIRENDYSQLTSLSSYLTISDTKAITEINGVEYPANAILFEISNSNGANISVIASGESGNFVSIYGYDYDSDGKLRYLDENGNLVNEPVALYSMYTPTNSSVDIAKYFTYDSATGNTSTVAEVAQNTDTYNKLYAHIFKVPKGRYFVGSPRGSVKVYYMAVQGQTSGTIDEINVAQGINKISGVDFLLCDPTSTDPRRYAKLTYSGKFNKNIGTIRVYCEDKNHLIIMMTNSDLENLDFVNNMKVWNQGTFSFYFNSNLVGDKIYTYSSSSN